ncbi:MAG: hypothetical protein P8L18_01165 [Verrucomicrobiota bacterium]|nr:hypothetical protein [Verrucomicrobiota bacterium]
MCARLTPWLRQSRVQVLLCRAYLTYRFQGLNQRLAVLNAEANILNRIPS